MNNMIKIDRFNVIDRVASSMESTTDDISKHTVYHYYDEDTNIQVRMHVDEWDNTPKSEIINELAIRYVTILRSKYIDKEITPKLGVCNPDYEGLGGKE